MNKNQRGMQRLRKYIKSKESIRRWIGILCALFVSMMLPTRVQAVDEPPAVVIIVNFAEADLDISIRLSSGEVRELSREQRAWETVYRYYYGRIWNELELKDAQLIIHSSKRDFTCTIPYESLAKYYNTFTLSLCNETLRIGKLPLRHEFLLSLRLVGILLAESFIFWVMGYRKRESWKKFLMMNLMAHLIANYYIQGPTETIGYLLLFVLFTPILYIIEMAYAIGFIDEQSELKGTLTVLAASSASTAAGLWLITFLPI